MNINDFKYFCSYSANPIDHKIIQSMYKNKNG